MAAVARAVGLDAGEPVDARTLPDDQDAAARGRWLGRRSSGACHPEQKRAFVHALQADGHVVAMTGDGVNDALALKDADIGVAMGNGAQATKAVAELVLLDGRFSHLPDVLAEGRRVIGNVERVANLFVAKNAMSLLAILAAAVSRDAVPLPASPPDARVDPDHRDPGVLPRARAQQAPLPARASSVASCASPCLRVSSPGSPSSRPTSWPAEQLRRAPGGVRRRGARSPQPGDVDVDLACIQPGTGATITLLVVFFWILVVLARPFRWWKAALIGTMAVLAVLAFVLPIGHQFFGFNAPAALVWPSLGIGVVGAGPHRGAAPVVTAAQSAYTPDQPRWSARQTASAPAPVRRSR